MRSLIKIVLLVSLVTLLSSCQSDPTPTPQPTPTNSPPAALPTLPPSATPLPTATLLPTALPTAAPEFPIYQGAPLNANAMGVQVHLHRQDVGQMVSYLQILGVGWVKTQLSWKLFEPEPGRSDEFLWGELDQLVEQSHSAGLNILISVAKAPEWSRPTTEMDGPPADFALFEQFMNKVASRYAGKVLAYELWNEPNLQREWNGLPLSATQFVALVKAGAAGVRAADPAAVVISGAPAPTGINDGVSAIDDRVYFQEMLTAGVADVVDGLGFHPYSAANAPDSQLDNPDPLVSTHNNHPSFYFRNTLNDYQRLMVSNPGPIRPLWGTEFGWGSFDQIGPVLPGVEYMGYINEWQQAEYTVRAFELAQEQTRPELGVMFLWNLNFAPVLGTQFAESGYSLLRPDGSFRPVFLTLQHAEKK